jgi:hypothetical protein
LTAIHNPLWTNTALGILNKYLKPKADKEDFIFPLVLDKKRFIEDEEFRQNFIDSSNHSINFQLNKLGDKLELPFSLSNSFCNSKSFTFTEFCFEKDFSILNCNTIDFKGKVSYSIEFRNLIHKLFKEGSKMILIKNVYDRKSDNLPLIKSDILVIFDIKLCTQ